MGGSTVAWVDALTIDNLWGVLKWVYVLAFSLYVAFALVVLAQIKQMVASFHGPVDGLLKLIGLIHLLVAVGALMLAVVVL